VRRETGHTHKHTTRTTPHNTRQERNHKREKAIPLRACRRRAIPWQKGLSGQSPPPLYCNGVSVPVHQRISCSKGFALTLYRALTWYSSPARPFAAPDDPQLVTGQQGSPSLACQQLSSARNVCAGGSSEGSTKFKHGTKLGRMLAKKVNRTSASMPAASDPVVEGYETSETE